MLNMSSKNVITPQFNNALSMPCQKGERILIVDDEPIIRDILERLVSCDGYHCETAQNGKEAVSKLETGKYEMVLSDVRMPVMDGLHLLRHITANFRDVAVIMVTAVADANSAIDTLALGAYDYIIKPFNASDLRNKIAKALERRRLVTENKQYQHHLEVKVDEQTASLRKALADVQRAYAQTLETLINALDAREQETQRHSKRVSEYALLLARRMNVPEEELIDIARGALLHDIGKIGISDAVLLKPAKLTEEEWVSMRKHPEVGYNILKGIGFLEGAAQMVLQHHEKYDGTGYPRGLRGEQIMRGARIFAAIDTFDAMTSDRPYRKALSYQIAREEVIRFNGRQFDPAVVECFLSIPEEVWFKTKDNLLP
jgi:putative nucleotidyltransferase with HDIG domain